MSPRAPTATHRAPILHTPASKNRGVKLRSHPALPSVQALDAGTVGRVSAGLPVLRSVLVTPLSGPLARFGRAGAAALQIWAESMPEGVDLQVHDAYPDPAAAMGRATATRPEVVFGPYGSGPTVQAVQATSRVVWNQGGATSRLRRPEFPGVVNVLAPARSYFATVLQAIRSSDPETRTALLFAAATTFGREVADGGMGAAAKLGFEVQHVEFRPGKALEASAVARTAEVLLVAGSFEDETALAGALLPGGWRWAVFVGAGVEEVLPQEVREGLLGPAQWVAEAAPEADEGPAAEWFVDVYRDRTGEAPSYPAAQAFAAGILWARAAREAGSLDEARVLEGAFDLHCRTLFGDFRLDPATGLQVGHQVLVVQWQGSKRRVVWPPDLAQVEPRPLR